MNPLDLIDTEEDSRILSIHGTVSSSRQDGKYRFLLMPHGSSGLLGVSSITKKVAKRKLLLKLKSYLWWHCRKIDELDNA